MSRRVGVSDAARLLCVKPNTFRYYLRAGRVQGAIQHGTGSRSVWTVPLGPDGLPVVEVCWKRGPLPSWLKRA